MLTASWMRPAAARSALLLVCAAAPGCRDRPPEASPFTRPCPSLTTPRSFVDGHRPALEVRVPMAVDVDGAPNAYGPRGMKTLDILAHARAPRDSAEHGQIVGYMTEYEGGPPTVQGKNDPYPGFYVSQTDFADKNNPRMEDPRRYVDAARINYVVQGKAARDAGAVMGDFATVFSCRTGKSAYAIIADSGNESGAEGSLALVRALGYPIENGIEDSVDEREIVIRYYPRSNPDKQFFKSQQELDSAATKIGLHK